jgi:hypothetical protein
MSGAVKNFSDLGIKPGEEALKGDKIHVKRLFNERIIVHRYRIAPSKVKDGTRCLHLQIEYKNEMRVVFIASEVLMGLIERVPKNDFPFAATIVNNEGRYEFN